MDVPHYRLRDPGNLMGVPLLQLASSGVFLLGPPGGGLLSAFVASSGGLHLSIEARFGVGQVGGQLSSFFECFDTLPSSVMGLLSAASAAR